MVLEMFEFHLWTSRYIDVVQSTHTRVLLPQTCPIDFNALSVSYVFAGVWFFFLFFNDIWFEGDHASCTYVIDPYILIAKFLSFFIYTCIYDADFVLWEIIHSTLYMGFRYILCSWAK